MINFGIGGLLFDPNGGNLATNPTPHEALTIQDVSLDITQKLVELMGQYKLPDDVAPSDMKITGKFNVGRQDFDLFNQIMFADTTAVGGIIQILDESHNIPATPGPYTVVVTGSATFGVDKGVTYVGTPPGTNQQQLARVTGSPATGQYAVSAGTYTFAAADQGLPVHISYTETNTTVGKTWNVNNQLQGYGPVFGITIIERYWLASNQSTNSPGVIWLPACRCSKLSQDFKMNEYVKPAFEFTAFPTSAGNAIQFVNPGAA